MLRLTRRLLDGLYLACGYVAAGCLLVMLGVIVAQMVARWAGLLFPGAASYAGYCMAAASFLGFAHALGRGAHIRVGLLLTALGRHRRWAELWCFAIGTLACLFLARHMVALVWWSHKLGDVSQGQDATPLWIVQMPVAFGACVLALAMADHLLRVLLTGQTGILDEART